MLEALGSASDCGGLETGKCEVIAMIDESPAETSHLTWRFAPLWPRIDQLSRSFASLGDEVATRPKLNSLARARTSELRDAWNPSDFQRDPR